MDEVKEESTQSSAPTNNNNQGPVPINITVNTGSTEEKEKKISSSDLIARIITGLLALSSIGLAIYCVFAIIHDKAYTKESEDSYITLTGKSYEETQKIYARFGTTDSSKSNKLKIKDYSILGTKLFLSESKITPSLLNSANLNNIVGSGYQDIYLYDVTNNLAKQDGYATDTANEKFYIDLSIVNEADYLIYPETHYTTKSDSDIYPFSINSEEAVSLSFYTLPNDKGERKNITLKSNSSSPYLVLKVRNCGTTLPDNIYDAVILNQQYTGDDLVKQEDTSTENMSSLDAKAILVNQEGRFKLKAVSSVKEASQINCNVSLSLSNTLATDVVSVYNKQGFTGFDTKTLETTSQLSGYDYYPEIRELSGYIDKAGEGYAGVIGNDLIPAVTNRRGKEAFLLVTTGRDETTLKNVINSVLSR